VSFPLPLSTLLSSNVIPFDEDTETCVITSAAQSGLNLTTTVVYSGPCDFQAATAGEFYDPSGAIQTVDAVVVIDTPVGGTPPVISAEMTVTIAGVGYSIILVENWAYPPAHIELRLKKGPQAYQGPK
jgi:hypothetical protein